MSSVKSAQKGGIKSKIICKYFILGKCNKGENCPYLHSQVEKPKEMIQTECPMYSVGFCKNGPVCHFKHIKKDKFVEEESEEKKTDVINDEKVDNNKMIDNDIIKDKSNDENNKEDSNKNNNLVNDDLNNNLNDEKNGGQNEKIYNQEGDEKYPVLPIWYLEHYYDKTISMIFSELDQENSPEIIELKKKYGFTNIEPNLPIVQPINKKNKINVNMNTLNLNFNNFNMNLALNNNSQTNITNNSAISNSIQMNNQINQMNNNIKFDQYKLKKDSIEYLINKEDNIFYYLIRCKNNDEIKKSSESNTIQLTPELYNKYKDIDIKKKKLTIIIILFDDKTENFAGFAQLKYPLPPKSSVPGEGEEEGKDDQSKMDINYYKIEWLWRTKLHYSKVSHLMNRADDDHFIQDGANGCPIDSDLGNYCCRLMIKRLSKEEVKELINEKKIFENQNKILQNLRKEEYNNNYYNTKYNNRDNYQRNYNNNYNNNYNSNYNNNYNSNYNNNYNSNYNSNYNNNYKSNYSSNYNSNSYKKYDNSSNKKYRNKYNNSSPNKYSNKNNMYNDSNYSYKKDFKYIGQKKYRNSSKSRSRTNRSDSEDYSNSYKNVKMKKNDEKTNSSYKQRYDYKNYENRHYNNDDNKSTDFSSRKSHY